MSIEYYFDLNAGGLQFILNDELNVWEEISEGDCSVITSGIIQVVNNPKKLVCLSGPPDNKPVVTLLGASWETKIGDIGIAEGHLFKGCTPTKWHLVLKD